MNIISKKWFVVFLMLIFSTIVKAQPGPPYAINWINKIGVITSGTTLTKTVGTHTWTHSGATSSNILPANTDGWMEFSTAAGSDFIIGLAVNNIIDAPDFAYGLRIQFSGNCSAYEGNASVALAPWQAGDVFRISRVANLVTYSRNNNEVLRTVTVNPAWELKVKVTIQYPGKTTPPTTTSFDSQLVPQSIVSGLEGNNTSGGISMSVAGGTPPYVYSWSSGEHTSAITNKPQGSYAVTISDAAGRTQNRMYGLGYKINWINKIGVLTNGDILTKSLGTTTWVSGGTSSNILPANTNGWMEFTVTSSADYIIGLAVNNIIDYSEFTHGIRIQNVNNTIFAQEGTSAISLGLWRTGDVVRVERNDAFVRYYHNGVVLRTVTVNPASALKVKVTIQHQGKSTPNIVTSFDGQMVLQGTVTGLAGNTGSGSISVSATGGAGPYAYSWSSGEQTSSIGSKQRGSYTVTVTDAVGRTQSRTYGLGYKINWINKTGVITNGDILTKSTPTHIWTNAGAISSNILPPNTNGWIEFSTEDTPDFIIGLSTNNTINYSEFNNGIRMQNASTGILAHESGAGPWLGVWQTGDVLRIEREGDQVNYYKNGVAIRNVTVNPALALKVKVTIQYPGKSTPNVNTSFWMSDGVVRTYYSIGSGNWTSPSIWSLSENGPPSTVYPDDIDNVVIKGHEVTINSSVKASGVTISATNDNTKLKVDGNMGVLTVKGNIVMNRENNLNTAEVLLVQNNGKLDVK